jgi:cell division septum initiation protein DivIVA
MTHDVDMMQDQDQELFESQMRGYSRQQVKDYVTKSRREFSHLEEQLSHSRDENERLRLELSAARQGLANKPPHEEISERVGQILKLADDEAKSQRKRAQEEINKLRDDAKKEADRFRAEAREQTERMLNAAQEQAENAIATARAEAEKMRNSARIETERAVSEATKEAEAALSSAKAQAKQMLDEATMRATAIHDGAERRLNLLTSRHTETMRRLTEIRDVVTNLVTSETARGSLEEEVNKSVASAIAASGAPTSSASARPASAGEGRRTAAAAAAPAGRGGVRDSGPDRNSSESSRAGSSARAGTSADTAPSRPMTVGEDHPGTTAANLPRPTPPGSASAGGETSRTTLPD